MLSLKRKWPVDSATECEAGTGVLPLWWFAHVSRIQSYNTTVYKPEKLISLINQGKITPVIFSEIRAYYCFESQNLAHIHEGVSATVSVIPSSRGVKSQIVPVSHSNDRHNHLNMSQVFLKCSTFGGRPALVLSSGGIYRGCQEKHLSHSHYWLLIRECSTKSTSTKSLEAEMATKVSLYQSIQHSNSSVPSCVKSSIVISLQWSAPLWQWPP